MKRMLRDWGAAVLVGLFVFLAVDWISSSSTPKGAAPAFELVNVAGGTTKLSDFAGKTVILNFWGSWCPPCREEIPGFAAYATDNPDVTVLGVAVKSGSGAELAKAADRLGVTYPVLESTSSVLSAYNVDVYPTTFIIGPDGQIHKVIRGAIGRSELEQAVAAAH